MSDWIDDPSCTAQHRTSMGVAEDQTINNNTTNDPAKCADPETCAGTWTKLGFGALGAALGFGGGWLLSDARKKEAQERAYGIARSTGEGLRRGLSAPRASNPTGQAAVSLDDHIDDLVTMSQIKKARAEGQLPLLGDNMARKTVWFLRHHSHATTLAVMRGLATRLRAADPGNHLVSWYLKALADISPSTYGAIHTYF